MVEVTGMPIETDLPEFSTWILPALERWLLAGLGLLTLCCFVGLLWCLLLYRRHGWRRFGDLLVGGFLDLVRVNGRRIGALAWLTVKEALGRRVTVVVLIFLLGLLFAGWFLDPASTEPHRLYLNFVLGTTNYLVLLLMVFLTAFRLPSDIQNKTIYTVLTKPVRTVEIVTGQVLGFIVVGSILLGIMWIVSYPFVVRGLYHTHQVNVDELRPLGEPVTLPDGSTATALQGWTASTWQHRHRFFVDANGNPRVDRERGHYHNVTVVRSADGKTSYVLGGPEGQLVARVPVYAKKLTFRDRGGLDTEKGISVGDEWIYRSYIEGGTEAAGIWTFENLRPEDFPGDTIPVEMNIGVFRTHKGDIERGILGSLLIRNPENGLTVELQVFESKEFSILELQIPKTIRKFSSVRFVQRRAKAPDGSIQYSPAQPLNPELLSRTEFDLFKDFVVDGKVEVWLQCLESGQYFGMAKPDLYIRAGNRSFFANLFKGYLGIWLQMVVLVGFGVTLSTFLGTPVTLVSTLGVMIAGMAHQFMVQIVTGELYPEVETPWRGGPLESLIRLVLQEGVMTDLPQTAGTVIARAVDVVFLLWMDLMAQIIPPMERLSLINFVSYGYDVSLSLLAVNAITVVGYLIPLVIVGHFFLRSREVAA